MASIPLQTIVDLHALSDRNRGRWVKRKEYEAYTDDKGRFRLTHYGTVIFTIDPSTRRYTVSGRSASDRDAVNSMLHIYGIREKSSAKGGSVKLSTGAAEASYNKKKPAKSRDSKPKTFNETLDKELEAIGYQTVEVYPVGFDEMTHGNYYIVLGKRLSDGKYATWFVVDWTKHPDPVSRKRGVTVNHGRYQFDTKAQAVADAKEQVRYMKENADWSPIRDVPQAKPVKKNAVDPATIKNDVTAKTSFERLGQLGYDLIKEKVTGKDPDMKYVESVIIGRRRSDDMYAVWYGIDWTKHPNTKDRKNGFTVNQGVYDLYRSEAESIFKERVENSSKFKWDPVGSANTRKTTGKTPAKSPAKKRTTSGATAPADFGRCRYSRQTLGQVRIQAAYYDAEASKSKGRPVYNALLYGDDWAVDYDPKTGLYERMVGRNEREAADVKRRGQLVFRPGIPAPATRVDDVGDIRMRDIAKAMVADRMVGSANGKPGFNDLPRPEPSEYASAPYAQRTSGGHRILKVYYDSWESRWYDRPVYDVVATRQDLGGLIWGRDYDPMSGLWSGGDYHQTEEQIDNHASGHRLIASYNVSRSACAGSAGKSTASKQLKPAQPRKANGQFAKKPKAKGGRR